ncbi:hypothetical protein PIROE2DRAFT_18247, partial [Piromyces sp. E2]
CAVDCTFKEINEVEEPKITIGKPLCNCKLYILDKNLNVVPIGVEGEIFIGGYGVGKGYLNRPELTKEKFVECPFHDGNPHDLIMYRTGDLGKWMENGEIDYLGRIDFQVKIHGQRIELSEIENTIKEIEGIEYCAVIDKIKESGDKYLVCYYISGKGISGRDIRNYLKSKLPLYMVPNYFISIENIPVTSNGKLNRKALPEPNISDVITEQYIVPETEIEKMVCKIYSSVFNIDENEIGKMSDFHELGGDSLNAIRMTSKIEKELNIKINIKDILSNSSVFELSKFIENNINNENGIHESEIIKRYNSKEFPITSQQLGVYIDSIKNSNSIMYNVPYCYKLKENVNIEKIKKALLNIFNEQEILRSKYYDKEINDKTEVYGFIDDECSLEFEEYTHENANSFIRPFELSKAPLIRVGFINNEALLIDMHHIISDGMTMSNISKYLNNYYHDLSNEKLEIQFSDYAINLNEKMNESYFNKQIEFYKQMFDDEEYEELNIQGIKKSLKKNENELKIKSCTMEITENNSSLINKFIENNGLSKTSFFLSIYGFVLSKYSGQNIIYSSIVNANRNNRYTENMIGMFVSTQPILLKYKNEETPFIDIMKQTMNNLIDLYDNLDISFSSLKNTLKLKNVNNIFIYQPKSIIESNVNDSIFAENEDNDVFTNDDGTYNNNDDNINNISKFDLSISIIEKENKYIISVDFNPNIYEEKLINNIVKSYIEVVNNVNHYHEKIKDIEYIPREMKEKILNVFNNNNCEYEHNKLYHVEFSRIAKENASKTAIINNDEKISFKKLDEMSNSLAHYLRSQGIKRNDIVPIVSERSYYYVVACIAIMKAGGAYLPIDPEFPIDRIEYMISETNAKFILSYITSEKNNQKLQFENISTYPLDRHNYQHNIQEITNVNDSSDLSYVIFTSGTTGKPKGTLITHDNLINYCMYCQTYNGKEDVYGDDYDNVLAFSKFTFDMSVTEISYPLLRGSTVILCNDSEFNDSELLSYLIKKHHVMNMFTAPSRFKNYLTNDNFAKAVTNLKWVIFGGEQLDYNNVKYLQHNTNARIYNGYGPTEATACCTYKEIHRNNEDKMNSNIGKPLCNCNIYILDKNMKPVPIGIEGEIFIGGYGVCKGYLNREELTHEKFVDCPFFKINNSPSKMYRTGDLGKWTEDGDIAYLGRIDFQVKIRGQRIELSEITNTIIEMNGINNAVVIDKQNENGNKYLVCYYMTNENINGKEINDYLKAKLPLYMIPSYFIKIERVPVTPNGKLDRNALPEPQKSDLITEQYVAPETEIEKLICRIYSKLFNIDEKEIGKMSDFYALGGDSLNAIRVISEIKKNLNIKLNIKDIMNNSTVLSLASLIESIKSSNDNNYETGRINSYHKMEYPITPLLSGLAINANGFDLESFKNSTDNMNIYYQLKEPISIEKLTKAFNLIINRHKVLKTVFIEKNVNGKNKIYGKIRDNVKLEIEHYTVENFESFKRPFDITKDLLIRVGIIDNSVLMIDIDHKISDGYSFGILMKELYQIYNDEILDELPIQYSDYAIQYDEKVSSKTFSHQLEYYKSVFDENVNTVQLPTKKNINENNIQKEYKMKIVNTEPEIYNIVNKISKENNISKTAFFLTLYSFVLSQYSGQNNIFSAIMSSNRTNDNTENLIGLFVRYMPVLVKIENTNLIDLMKKCMDMILTIYGFDIPFSKLSEELHLPQSNSWFKFDPYEMVNNDELNFVKLINHDDIYKLFNKENPSVKNDIPFSSESADLQFVVTEKINYYEINFIYNSAIYEESLINDMINHFINIIKNENYFKNNTDEILINNSSSIDISESDSVYVSEKSVESSKKSNIILIDENKITKRRIFRRRIRRRRRNHQDIKKSSFVDLSSSYSTLYESSQNSLTEESLVINTTIKEGKKKRFYHRIFTNDSTWVNSSTSEMSRSESERNDSSLILESEIENKKKTNKKLHKFGKKIKKYINKLKINKKQERIIVIDEELKI